MANRTGALYYLNPVGRTLMELEQQQEFVGPDADRVPGAGARVRIIEEALPVAESDGVWSGDSVLSSRDGCESSELS
jgi:hypothetical protein